ncbi:MAG: hemerythrin domain-containing protein [Rubrivivax sp.]|nr:hemerythrin domain-containing protein [Rubrivivax sp.]
MLGDSHDKQRLLCLRLTRTRAANPQGRSETLTALRIELAAHAAAEERYLYAPMLMDDRGLGSARHALAEHHDIDELVETLLALDAAGSAWGDAAKALAHKVRHHLKEEESKFFQISGKILSEAQKTSLAGKYQRDFKRMREVAAQG